MEGSLLNVALDTDLSLCLQSLLNEKGNVLPDDFMNILKKLLLENDEDMLKVLVRDLKAMKDLQEDNIDEGNALLELMVQLFQGEISFEDKDKDRQLVMLNEGKTEVKMVDQVEGNVNHTIKFDIDLSNGIVSDIDVSKNIKGSTSTLIDLPVMASSNTLGIMEEMLLTNDTGQIQDSSHAGTNVEVIESSETENVNEDVKLLQNNVLQQHHSNEFTSSLIDNKALTIEGMVYDERQSILENEKTEVSVVVGTDVLDESRVKEYRTFKMEELIRKHKGDFSVRFSGEHYTIPDPVSVVPISADDWEADIKKLVFVKELVKAMDGEKIDNKESNFVTIVKDHNIHSRKQETSFLNKFDEIVIDRIRSTYTSSSRSNWEKVKDNDDLLKELGTFSVSEKDESIEQSAVDNHQTDKIVWDYKVVSRSDLSRSLDSIAGTNSNHVVDRMMNVVNTMKMRNKYPSYMMMKINEHVIKIKLSFDVEHGNFSLEVLTNRDMANMILSHRDALLNAFLEKEIDVSSMKILAYQENDSMLGNYSGEDTGFKMDGGGYYFSNHRDMKKYTSLLESIYGEHSGLREETSSRSLVHSLLEEYNEDSGVNVYV